MENEFKAVQQDLFDTVAVSWYDHSQQFGSRAKLRIGGYLIELETEYFDTIDEAVINIKERIAEAVTKFKPEENGK